ncbi:MAG: hypothetical protein ACFFF9_12105 [Candidatus Thorarchaeota archaeon]
MEERVSVRKPHLDSIKESSLRFESFTEKFLSSSLSNQIKCPSCKNTIDFNGPVKWYGPDTFSCGSCDRYLSMRLVERAMRDLGMRSFEITEM